MRYRVLKTPIWIINSTSLYWFSFSNGISTRTLFRDTMPAKRSETPTTTHRQRGARTKYLKASTSQRPTKHTPLIPSPSILFIAERVAPRFGRKQQGFLLDSLTTPLWHSCQEPCDCENQPPTLPAIVKKIEYHGKHDTSFVLRSLGHCGSLRLCRAGCTAGDSVLKQKPKKEN